MYVRPADSHGSYPYLHLSRTGIFDRLLRQPEFPLRDEFGNQHLQSL